MHIIYYIPNLPGSSWFLVSTVEDGDFGGDDFGGYDDFNNDQQNEDELLLADKQSTSKGLPILSKPLASAQSHFPKSPTIPKRIRTKPIEQVRKTATYYF